MKNSIKPTFVKPDLVVRGKIENLLNKTMQMPQLEIDNEYCHIPGLFAKTAHFKKNTLIVGKIHLKEHINVMSSGDITVVTEEGIKRLTGFNILACKPGSRRVGFCHEDTIWTTFFMTDETDPETVEDTCTTDSHLNLEN